MGLLRAGLSIAITYWVYRYVTTHRLRLQKIPYIGPWLSKTNPLVVVIVALILLNTVL